MSAHTHRFDSWRHGDPEFELRCACGAVRREDDGTPWVSTDGRMNQVVSHGADIALATWDYWQRRPVAEAPVFWSDPHGWAVYPGHTATIRSVSAERWA